MKQGVRAGLEQSLLVASVLGRDLAAVDAATARLGEALGPLAFVSEPLPFTWTDYYAAELGDAPLRRLVAGDRLVDTSCLPEVKHTTGRLEVVLARPADGHAAEATPRSPGAGWSGELTGQRRRTVNLDPGCLGLGQLVMASTKPRAHRIHIGRGVHGDLQLLWGADGFAPLPWTYPDYASPALRELCGHVRELLRRALQRERLAQEHT